LINFFKQQLKEFHPRDDYKELLILALLFLGTNDNPETHVNAPGACHRARSMSKIIYALKMPFRDQFSLSERELSSLRQFNVFVVRLYLRAWYQCQQLLLHHAVDTVDTVE